MSTLKQVSSGSGSSEPALDQIELKEISISQQKKKKKKKKKIRVENRDTDYHLLENGIYGRPS